MRRSTSAWSLTPIYFLLSLISSLFTLTSFLLLDSSVSISSLDLNIVTHLVDIVLLKDRR